MLSSLVGAVDFNSAMVLVAAFGAICIMTTTMIAKRRSRTDISNEFELAKMKADAEAESIRYRNETARSIEFKKIDQGLITSHRAQD